MKETRLFKFSVIVELNVHKLLGYEGMDNFHKEVYSVYRLIDKDNKSIVNIYQMYQRKCKNQVFKHKDDKVRSRKSPKKEVCTNNNEYEIISGLMISV